jgi:hypothetical protein
MNIYVAHSKAINFKENLYQPIKQGNWKDCNFTFPHENSDEPFNSRAYLQNEADLVVAEVSKPSIGVGIELGWADLFEVPILCIYKKGERISGSLRVVSDQFIEYSDARELIIGIKEVVSHL